MIHILHGEDNLSSYRRLQEIVNSLSAHQKVRLDEKAQRGEFINEVLTEDLISLQKLIICENFILLKKVNANDINSLPKSADLVFWEREEIPKSTIAKLDSSIDLELFKNAPRVFYFLDSISGNLATTLKKLDEIKKYKQKNLTWHIANRLMLLIMASSGIKLDEAQKIAGKKIYDWQWQKISSQAKLVDLSALKKLFAGTLTIDYLIKNGKTNFEAEPLISTLFIKYLS